MNKSITLTGLNGERVLLNRHTIIDVMRQTPGLTELYFFGTCITVRESPEDIQALKDACEKAEIEEIFERAKRGMNA